MIIRVSPTMPHSSAVLVMMIDGPDIYKRTVDIRPNTGPTRTDLISVYKGLQGVLIVKCLEGQKARDLSPGLRATIQAKVNVRSDAEFIRPQDITPCVVGKQAVQ